MLMMISLFCVQSTKRIALHHFQIYFVTHQLSDVAYSILNHGGSVQ